MLVLVARQVLWLFSIECRCFVVVGDINSGRWALQWPCTLVTGWVVLLCDCHLALWQSQLVSLVSFDRVQQVLIVAGRFPTSCWRQGTLFGSWCSLFFSRIKKVLLKNKDILLAEKDSLFLSVHQPVLASFQCSSTGSMSFFPVQSSLRPIHPISQLILCLLRLVHWFSFRFKAYLDRFSGFLSDSKHIQTGSMVSFPV